MPEYLPLADQLRILFGTVRKPDGDPYTLKEVNAATGISLPALSQLKNGKITNPQLNTLRSLCRFFNVPLQYFDTTSADECLAIIAEGRRDDNNDADGLNYITTMAAALSPEGQKDLLTIIKWAQAAEHQLQNGEGLPPMPRLSDSNE